VESSGVTIHYDEALKNAAGEVLELYPRIKRDLEGILGWQVDFTPVVILIGDHAKFLKITDNPYITAFAVPARRIIVIDYSRMNINPFTLGMTLKHEMCHLLLGDRIPDERLPRWLNEGFCQWVTGGIAELMVDGRQPSLSKAMLAHRLIPLATLRGHFPGDREELILAYEESRSVIDHMVAEHGRDALISILGYLSKGDALDEAMRKALSLGLDEFERQWVNDLQGRTWWVGYLAANIYSIILFAASLLTIGGFWRLIARRRLRTRLADEDDGDIE
jgi:hypothetical protein